MSLEANGQAEAPERTMQLVAQEIPRPRLMVGEMWVTMSTLRVQLQERV